MQLHLKDITYSYEDASECTLDKVSVTFPEGWTGLIGDNGCGKTTLALIVAGKIKAHAGTVAPTLFTAYCPQDTSIAPDNLADFASDWSPGAMRIRNTLMIDDAWLWDYDHLSGGQKKRMQIACALGMHPDVLILDEPTNDVDSPTRNALLESLRSLKGIGILISHDRALLDALVEQCAIFEEGRVSMHPGGYTKVMNQLRQDRSAQMRSHKNARREEQRLQAEADRRNREAARSTKRLSAKHLDKQDSDSREKLGRAKVSSKDAIAGRAVKSMESRMVRAHKATQESHIAKRYEEHIQFPGKAARSKFVLHLPEQDLTQGELSLHVPSLWVGPTDHVSLSGANGAGKTTLIRRLCSLIPEQIEWAYIPQEVDDPLRREALDRLHALDPSDAGRVLSLVAGLNTNPKRLRDGSNISPGELKKLLIAEQLLHEPNLLILDEPTNHLDAGSVEALEHALGEYPGAIILASHDRILLDATCQIHWQITQDSALCITDRPWGELVE